MVLSSHLFIMLLAEMLVRLHNIGNANSKIRMVSKLQNMSLYCKNTVYLITGSKYQGLTLIDFCQICKLLKKKKKKKKAPVREGHEAMYPEFPCILSFYMSSVSMYPEFPYILSFSELSSSSKISYFPAFVCMDF